MYTYIIESQNLYKIGKTKDVSKRLSAYNTHTAQYKLKVVYDGDYEEHLHKMFVKKLSHLEWYRLTQDDIDSVELPKVEIEEEIMISSEVISMMEKGMSEAETKLYAHLLQNHNIGAEIGISKQIRLGMGKKLDLNERTVLNTLGMLVEKKLIYTTSKGVYKINPRYAYKGSTYNRNRDLKVVLEVECPHC